MTLAKKVGILIAKAKGNDVWFEDVDFEKYGRLLSCDPDLVALINAIINQESYGYIYMITSDRKLVLMDETNACGDYTPIPVTLEDLCKMCAQELDAIMKNPSALNKEELKLLAEAKEILDSYTKEDLSYEL